jgi:phospholipase C
MPLSHDRFPDYVPEPPSQQSLPKQERGLRRARALPYDLDVDANVLEHGGGAIRLEFKNDGKAGACFQVRSGSGAEGPWTFTVGVGKSLTNTWALAQAHGQYDLSVSGPNGFLRRFRGNVARDTDLDVDVRLDEGDYSLIVRVKNQAHEARRVRIANAYGEHLVDVLPRGRALEKRVSLRSSFGWYDVAVSTDGGDFLRRAAGHLENGRDSASDPAFGLG